MQTKSSFKAAFERAVQARDERPDLSVFDVERANYVLYVAGKEWREPISVVRVLVAHGLTVRQGHAVISDLAETMAQPVGSRRSIAVAVPNVPDSTAFESRLAALGVRAERRMVAAEVDVAVIRRDLGLSQEEFALRFGLDVGTLRGWEQGRFKPDTAARILLRVIAREPAAVERALAE